MNLSIDLNPTDSGIPKPRSQPCGHDLDCEEKLFHNLADRSRLCIVHTLCESAKTDSQIAVATGLSQSDVSTHLKRLLDCGCVTLNHTEQSVLFELSVPRFLQLEGLVDKFLQASLKHVTSKAREELPIDFGTE